MKHTRTLALGFLCVSAAWPDEGIWLVNQFPKKRVMERYGFDVTDQFLERLRLGSVRMNNGDRVLSSRRRV
jgi:hypothetical protein